MQMTVLNKETSIIRQIAGDFVRHPHQVNRLLEADAEIIRLPGKRDEYLVLKVDGIHEEIKEKLYEDPYLIGWMTVTAPVSDIAAVGAVPSGILLSLTLSQHYNDEWLKQFKAGINDACKIYNLYVLGGDTNFDDLFSVSATVVAYIHSQPPLLRSGMMPGDFLYSTGPFGKGNAYAYSRFFDRSFNVNYQPVARLNESGLISKYATACIDTSDGLFPALSLLSEINEVGFCLDIPVLQLLSRESLNITQNAKIPEWLFLAGPHGEYELLFTIPEKNHNNFIQAYKNEKWNPVYVGKVTSDILVNFISGTIQIQCHPAIITNLFYEAGENVDAYFELLMQQHQNWTKQ